MATPVESTSVAPAFEGVVPTFGRPVPPPVRKVFEPLFGVSLGGVRIHTDSAAASSAHVLDALAYTVGSDIVFGHGQFRPDTVAGRRLLAHELTHVVQRAGDSPASVAEIQLQRRHGAPSRVRFPTLETYSALSGGAFGSHDTPLSQAERADGEFVFESGIDFDAVRIVETPLVNAPTTLGNFIRIAPGATMSRGILIHELAHVWQYQTKGTSYISDSLMHQAASAITTGSRGAAYRVTIVPDQSIHSYTAEQQAVIIEQYFRNPALRSNPDYRRMIEEVRRSRPLPSSQIVEEALLGPSGRAQRLLPPSTEQPGEPSPVAPLIRVHF